MTHPLPLAATLTAADLESLSASADNAVREAVARHPNTPPEVLGVLGEHGREADIVPKRKGVDPLGTHFPGGKPPGLDSGLARETRAEAGE